MVRAIEIDRDVFFNLSKRFYSYRKGRNNIPNTISCTYILKDRNSDVYKFGVAIDIHSRLKSIYHTYPYRKFDFIVFAYLIDSIEESLLEALVFSGARLAHPNSREMFLLTDADAEFITKVCGFTRVFGEEMMPYTFNQNGIEKTGPYPKRKRKTNQDGNG